MIIRAEDRKQILTPNARGGDGTLDKRDYVLENMPENAGLLAGHAHPHRRVRGVLLP